MLFRSIYAFGKDMTIPGTLDGCNVVSGNHADCVSLVSGYPYAVPVSFEADSASFTWTLRNGTEASDYDIRTEFGTLTVTGRSDDERYPAVVSAVSGEAVYDGTTHGISGLTGTELTGVTLPFLSAGGSSMISCWGLLAFIKAADERTYAAKRRIPKSVLRERGIDR